MFYTAAAIWTLLSDLLPSGPEEDPAGDLWESNLGTGPWEGLRNRFKNRSLGGLRNRFKNRSLGDSGTGSRTGPWEDSGTGSRTGP